MRSFVAFISLAFLSTSLFSQSANNRSPLDATNWGVVYDHPSVKNVKVRTEVKYSGDLGIDIFCMSRPLLEAVTRRRVQQTPNINICVCARVTRLVPSRDGMRIEAVRYDSEDGPVTLEADLVVEASGRCSLTLKLLKELSLKLRRELF